MGKEADPRLGSALAGYRLERPLGRGGMGIVYLAQDVRLGRNVALKLLSPELADDERFRERFLRESRLAASLDHPNIVPIYEAGESDGVLYIAMRYVEGTDLRTVLTADAPLPPERALGFVTQVAAALDAAHERGLVHRDVKPANVLTDARDHVYLSDFGLTKQATSMSGLTGTGQLVGTVDYAPPEQIRGDPVDGRADVYSLGCLLYESLAGQPPFRRDSEVATLWAHVNEDAPSLVDTNPQLPAEIDGIVGRALAKSPGDRYATCAELVEAARAALAPATAPTRRGRSPGTVVALAALLLSLPLALGLWLALRGDGKPTLKAVLPHHVAAIDPETNSLVGQGKVGLVPVAALEAHGAVWVANASEHTITRVDADSIEPGTSVGLAGAPVALVADDRSVLAVTTHHPQSLVRINIGDLTQPEERTTELTGAFFGDISLSSAARADGDLWISVPVDEAGHDIVRVDSSDSVVARLDAFRDNAATVSRDEGDLATGVAAGAGGIWVTSMDGQVVRIDPRSNRVRRMTVLEASPRGIAVGEGAVWVVDQAGNKLWRLHPRTGRPQGTIRVGVEPVAVAVGHGSVWVANRDGGTVSRVDPKTERVTTIRVGSRPESISVGEERVWMTVSDEGAVVS